MSARTALVTGAASGIGRAAALRLARDGMRVMVTDRVAGGAANVASEMEAAGGVALHRALDVTDEGAWAAAAAAVEDAWGSLDVLVHSAGVTAAAPLADTSLEEWRRVMAVNLDGAFLAVRTAARAMAAGGGAVVLVGSASGIKAPPGAAAYAASKAGLIHLARAAALELAPAGIRVNSVNPAGVATPMWRDAPFFTALVEEHGEEGAWARLAADTPLKRFATAEEVAATIAWMVSEEAAYLTGASVPLDGGYTAG